MNKISCDICIDLIPLVKDGVASNDSLNAVEKHITECKSCRELFNKNENQNKKMNDKKVISKIKNQLIIIALSLVVIGSFIGVSLSESEAMFYNVLIMPVIGMLGYYALRKKSFLVPISIFIMVYIYHIIKYIMKGMFYEVNNIQFIIAPLTWSVIYSGLCLLGIFIAFLLYIAFKKEDE